MELILSEQSTVDNLDVGISAGSITVVKNCFARNWSGFWSKTHFI